MEKILLMMRIFILCLFVASLAACKNEPVAEEASVTKTQPILPPEGGPITGENKRPSMQTEHLFDYLCSGYWYIEGYSKINDPEAHAKNRGRWFQFSKEGTFRSGKYKETGASGIWTYDPMKALLFMDSANDAEDGEWKLQMAKNGAAMVLVGTERFMQNSIQFKLENYIELMAELPAPTPRK